MKPKIMGVVNVTPDSYYQRVEGIQPAVDYALKLVKEGADLIDIGGESTRPGAPEVDESTEYQRVIPVIQALKDQCAIPISLDTRHVNIAEAGLKAGAHLLNDITGFEDSAMQRLAAQAQVPIIVMHMQGKPHTMQIDPSYPEGVINHLQEWFSKRIEMLLKAGIQSQNIIIDPGIGFGKTVAHNLEIIHNLARLKALGFPVLVGLSRKSFLSKILSKTAPDLLSATLAMNTCALLNGADLIRVHDVAEHRDIVDTLECYKKLQ